MRVLHECAADAVEAGYISEDLLAEIKTIVTVYGTGGITVVGVQLNEDGTGIVIEKLISPLPSIGKVRLT